MSEREDERGESMKEKIERLRAEREGGESTVTEEGAKGTNEGKTTPDSQEVTINDGTADGEKVKTVQGSRIPQANDVIEGRHVGRTPEEEGPRKVDGSESPHDPSSEGGSRQQAALTQTDPNREHQDQPEAQEVARDGRTGVATAGTPTTRPGGAA